MGFRVVGARREGQDGKGDPGGVMSSRQREENWGSAGAHEPPVGRLGLGLLGVGLGLVTFFFFFTIFVIFVSYFLRLKNKLL